MEFSSTRLVGTKRNNNFYFPYFSSFSDLFWLEMSHYRISFIFWIFYYFYGIFYYTSGRNETKRNDNFYFLSFPAFSNLFWLIMKPQWYFLIFWIFCYFFGIFYYTSGRNETEQYYLFSLFLSLFQLILASNEAVMVLF